MMNFSIKKSKEEVTIEKEAKRKELLPSMDIVKVLLVGEVLVCVPSHNVLPN
jgi:hypothetical protein